MSSISQAKAEAQKLIKQYNKLQSEAKTASADEAARKAAEAKKLVMQISNLQTTITQLQAKDRDAALKAQQTAKQSPTEYTQEELKRAEEEKKRLEDRIGRIENAQRKTRDQINQLNRAKAELSRLKSKAAQTEEERRKHEEKLQGEINKLIAKKEEEQKRLKDEVEQIRLQAAKDAEMLKLQRDSARAMAERHKEIITDKSYKARGRSGGSKGLILGILIGVISIVGVLVTLAFTTPVFDDFLRPTDATPTPPAAGMPRQPVATTPSPATSAPPKAPDVTDIAVRPIRTFRDQLRGGGTAPIMVLLPEGSFMMGASDSSPYRDERPRHKVSLASFAISKYEVTFDEYDRFVATTGATKPNDKGWGRGRQPIVNVNWNEAEAYTKWLTEQIGKKYRLPSEREWEYAARAGVMSHAYWWGNDIGRNNANCAVCGSQWDGRQTAPVGSFAPNAFGLHDMLGNVMEWTISCFRPSYQNAPSFGQLWEGGDCGKRIVRSGSYRTYTQDFRVTKRHRYSPATRMDRLGFRVVRVE